MVWSAVVARDDGGSIPSVQIADDGHLLRRKWSDGGQLLGSGTVYSVFSPPI